MSHKLLKSTLALSGAVFAGMLAAQTEWNEIAPGEHTWSGSETAFREGIYEIPVAAQSWLEYKLGIEEGDAVVYEWTAQGGEAGLLSTEFHGHTEPVDDKGDLMFYTIHADMSERGVLKAPFSGIHGWYLNNESDEDVTVTLKVAGFYTEIPDQL